MNAKRLLAALAVIGAWATIASAANAESGEFRLYIPAFRGQQPLGLNVATVINLRIWRTLRKAPTPNPSNLDFGNGTVIWDDKPIEEPLVSAMAASFRDGHYDMVVIGSAENYGNGIIAQTSLFVRALNERDAPSGAMWRIEIGGLKIDLGLPRRSFEFGTMVLRPEIIAAYSRPSALTLCPVKTTNCAGKPLGSSFAARRHEGEWSFVEPNIGDKGWVQLRQLGSEPNETVEFVGGLFSYLRGDMAQAQALFGKVSSTAAADSIVRQDAKILRVITRSRLGAMVTEEFDSILYDDPFSRYALQAAVMDALQRYLRDRTGLDRLKHLSVRVRNSRDLFEDDDPWFKQAAAIFNQLNL